MIRQSIHTMTRSRASASIWQPLVKSSKPLRPLQQTLSTAIASRQFGCLAPSCQSVHRQTSCLLPSGRRSYHSNTHQHTYQQHSSNSSNKTATSYLFALVGAAGSSAAVLYVASDYLSSGNVAYAQSTVDVNDTANVVVTNPLKQAAPPAAAYSPPASPSDFIRQQQLTAIDTLSGGDIIISPRWRRVLAGIIDSFVISAMSSVISYIFVNQYAPLQVPLMAVGNIIYECGSHLYFNGQTLGKMILQIRIIKEDGTPMDIQSAAILYATKLLNILFLSDYLWGLFNIHGDYKCLHNVFSKTVVALDK